MGGGAIKKVFGVFKKASKVAKKVPKAGGVPIPKGIKIGIFGHSAVGKTTYLSVLFGKVRNKQGAHMFQSRDALTARELLDNWNAIEGITSAAEEGRRVEKRVDPHFPSGTTTDKPLELLCRRGSFRSLRFFCLDYKGESVAIETPDDMREELAEFFKLCDAIIFMIERDVVISPELSRRHLAPFVNHLNSILERSGRTKIPIALVITKSDVWEEFISEDQVTTLTGSAAAARGQIFHRLWNRVLNLPRLKRFPNWDRCLSQIGENIRPFVEAAQEMTLQFQIFFVSATGPSRQGNVPPEQVQPIGLHLPFLWVLDRAGRRRGFKKMRKFAKWVFILGFCWALIVSLMQMVTWKWSSRGPSEWSDSWMIQKDSWKERRYREFAGKWYISGIFGLSDIAKVAKDRELILRGDSTVSDGLEVAVDGEEAEDESPECKQVLSAISAFRNKVSSKMRDPRYLSEAAAAEADQLAATVQGGLGTCKEGTQQYLTQFLSHLTEYKNDVDRWKKEAKLELTVVQIDRSQRLLTLDVKVGGSNPQAVTDQPRAVSWDLNTPWEFILNEPGSMGLPVPIGRFPVDNPIDLFDRVGKIYEINFSGEIVKVRIGAPTPWPQAPQ